MALLTRTRSQAKDYSVEHPDFVATLPRVDLLPAKVREDIAVHRIRRRFIALGALMLAGLGVVWYLQGEQITIASGALSSAQAENAAVNVEVKALTPVRLLSDQIAAQEELVTTALGSAPQSAAVIASLKAAAGTGVKFTDVSVSYTGVPDPKAAEDPRAALNPCPSPDPFTVRIAIGCIRFTGTASDRDSLSRFLAQVDRQAMLFGGYVDSSNVVSDGGDQTIAFTGTAAISTDALVTPLGEEQIAEIIATATGANAADGGAQ